MAEDKKHVNARMKERLRQLQATFADPDTETVVAIAAILRDEEPTCA